MALIPGSGSGVNRPRGSPVYQGKPVTVDQSGSVLEEVDVSRFQKVGTSPASSAMEEVTVTAHRIVGFDWRAWLKPPKVYIVGAVAAGIVYALATRKKRGRR
jgi:hypothetical protein